MAIEKKLEAALELGDKKAEELINYQTQYLNQEKEFTQDGRTAIKNVCDSILQLIRDSKTTNSVS